jgi:PPOX class probable F420-dependent enzyme
VDRHVQARLKKELVAWFVTVGANSKPQAVPVWFLWDGRSFLVYSQDGVKARHVQANPNVELHLNSDEAGDDLVRVSGEARIESTRPARLAPAYVRKYARSIKGLDMTPASFLETYHNAIRVRRLRYR